VREQKTGSKISLLFSPPHVVIPRLDRGIYLKLGERSSDPFFAYGYRRARQVGG